MFFFLRSLSLQQSHSSSEITRKWSEDVIYYMILETAEAMYDLSVNMGAMILNCVVDMSRRGMANADEKWLQVLMIGRIQQGEIY